MKRIKRKTIILIVLMIACAFILNFSFNAFHESRICNMAFWAISLGSAYFLFGFRNDKHLFKIDIIQNIFILCFAYLIIIYLSGLFFGYSRSPYSHETIKVVANCFHAIVIILMQEFFRYLIVSKNEKVSIIIVTLLFIIFNVSMGIGSYDFSDPMAIFRFIGLLLLPAIITNSLLTFLTNKAGFWPSIVYRLIFELYIYFVPIFPDLGIYIQSVLNILFPAFVLLRMNKLFTVRTFKTGYKKNAYRWLFGIPLTALTFTLIILVSGLFKYTSIAIGSNSMHPSIKKGDAIVYEKVKNYNEIEIGDILVHSHDGKRIVHRVINVKTFNDVYTFYTKGDNNDNDDNYSIAESDVIGIYRFKVSYIGLPSVWLSEALK